MTTTEPPGWPGYHTKLETVQGSGADVVLRSLRDRAQYRDPDGEAERAGIPAASWPRHSDATVEVLIADPNRGNQPRFNRKMGVLGYSHSARRMLALPDGMACKGQIHRYCRSAFIG